MKLDEIRPGQKVHVANGMSVGKEAWTVLAVKGRRVKVCRDSDGYEVPVHHARLRLIEEPNK